MNRDATTSLQGTFDHAYGMLTQFINICPDNIWTDKFGGWPIWQQVVHAISALDFFIAQQGSVQATLPCSSDECQLKEQGLKTVSKDDMKRFAEEAKKRADDYIAALKDTDLAAANAGLSARLNMPFTQAATIAMLGSHTLYHLGACDAALRAYGHKGVF